MSKMTYRERKEKEPGKVLKEIQEIINYDADPETRLEMIEKYFFGKKLKDYSIEKFNKDTDKWESNYSSIPFTLLESEIFSLKMTDDDFNLLLKRIKPFWQTISNDGTSPHKVIWKYYFPSWVFLREQRNKTKPQTAKAILSLAKNRFVKIPSEKALTTQFDKLHKDFKAFVNKHTPTNTQLPTNNN